MTLLDVLVLLEDIAPSCQTTCPTKYACFASIRGHRSSLAADGHAGICVTANGIRSNKMQPNQSYGVPAESDPYLSLF